MPDNAGSPGSKLPLSAEFNRDLCFNLDFLRPFNLVQVKALSSEERRALCHLYCSLAKKDVRGALRAAAFFGLDIGSHAEELKHLSLAAKGQQALKLLTIMFDTRWGPLSKGCCGGFRVLCG